MIALSYREAMAQDYEDSCCSSDSTKLRKEAQAPPPASTGSAHQTVSQNSSHSCFFAISQKSLRWCLSPISAYSHWTICVTPAMLESFPHWFRLSCLILIFQFPITLLLYSELLKRIKNQGLTIRSTKVKHFCLRKKMMSNVSISSLWFPVSFFQPIFLSASLPLNSCSLNPWKEILLL